jgi:crossover junction endonuclease MUS81
MLKIKIDNKEKNLYDIDIVNKEVVLLDIGDIQILLDDKLELIFERKTINDLYNSIKDGRYHEQKSRLVSNLPRNRICYIIEGNINNNLNPIYGAIIHTMYRDNIFVYRSLNIEDTKNFLIQIYSKFSKNIEMWSNFLEKNSLENCLNVESQVYSKKFSKKSENITNEIVYLNMLKCIPGISSKKAEYIRNMYPNIKLLVNSDIDSISNIMIDNKKLGKKIAIKIVELFSN